jgi:hypothetical protein
MVSEKLKSWICIGYFIISACFSTSAIKYVASLSSDRMFKSELRPKISSRMRCTHFMGDWWSFKPEVWSRAFFFWFYEVICLFLWVPSGGDTVRGSGNAAIATRFFFEHARLFLRTRGILKIFSENVRLFKSYLRLYKVIWGVFEVIDSFWHFQRKWGFF